MAGEADPTVKKVRAGGAKSKAVKPPAPPRPKRGLWFGPAPGSPEAKAVTKAEKPPRKRPREKFKHDPKMVAAARELRDRYIEEINAGRMLPPSASGKYDVSRQLEAAPSAMKVAPVPGAAPGIALLEAA